HAKWVVRAHCAEQKQGHREQVQLGRVQAERGLDALADLKAELIIGSRVVSVPQVNILVSPASWRKDGHQLVEGLDRGLQLSQEGLLDLGTGFRQGHVAGTKVSQSLEVAA